MRVFFVGLVALAAALLTIAAISVGCTDEKGAYRVLTADGVTDIQFTGFSPSLCGSDDILSTGFKGYKNGSPVSGAVCSGLMKGYTIRYK